MGADGLRSARAMPLDPIFELIGPTAWSVPKTPVDTALPFVFVCLRKDGMASREQEGRRPAEGSIPCTRDTFEHGTTAPEGAGPTWREVLEGSVRAFHRTLAFSEANQMPAFRVLAVLGIRRPRRRRMSAATKDTRLDPRSSHPGPLRRFRYFFFLAPPLLRGTFPPARRASDKPMAMACFRLVTFLPERPDRSVPRLRSCIARSTFC